MIRQIATALRNLNPNEVRALAERPVTFGVLAADEAVAGEIFRCLIPRDSSEAQMRRAGKHIVRVASEADFARCDVGFAESGVPHPPNFFRFDPMDRKGRIGYSDQKGQIGSIVAAAFGWRAIARELAGKIPAGGGLISKGLVSFAGTYVVGKGLERYFRIGRHLTRKEKRQFYAEAFEKGRSAVEKIVRRTSPSAAAHSGA